MNKIDDDKLKDVFAKVKRDSPSMSFENNLMQRIRAEHRLAERKQNRAAWIAMILGVVGMIAVPSIVFRLMGWSMMDILNSSEVTFWDTFSTFKIDPLIISISVVFLLLLMADTLIRTRIDRKEKK